MEFFLLHNAVIGIVSVFFSAFALGGYKKVALAALLVTTALSLLCHRLFRGDSQRGQKRVSTLGSGGPR